jgi:5'-nucleotidase
MGKRRQYHIYSDDLGYHHAPGTDFEAVAQGYVSITPLHFDLMSHEALDRLRSWEEALSVRDADDQKGLCSDEHGGPGSGG